MTNRHHIEKLSAVAGTERTCTEAGPLKDGWIHVHSAACVALGGLLAGDDRLGKLNLTPLDLREEVHQRLNRGDARVIAIVIRDLSRQCFCHSCDRGDGLPACRARLLQLALEVVND